MKILLSNFRNNHPYNQKHLEQIKKVAPNVEIILANDNEEVQKYLSQAEIIVSSPVGWDFNLTTAKELKWIHSMSAGVTNLVKLLKNSQVILTNSSGVHPIPIAEHVFGLMLMFSRRFNIAYRAQLQQKTWMRDHSLLNPVEITGQTLGIVGYGHIGAYVAKLAKGFDMTVIALENRSEIKDKNVDKVTKNLSEVLEASDFVINCLPETAETLGYFNKESFAQMKSSAYFINIGRGKTVVENDLTSALKNKTIAGAGLDVFESEPLPDESPLWNLDNVIISPHYSGWTPKYADRVMDIFCENLNAYIKNEPMPNLVDKEKGY